MAAQAPPLARNRRRLFQINEDVLTDATAQQQREWLLRSAEWPGLLYADGWRGVKVLGAGASALAGLWRNIVRRTPPTYVVVKQTRPGNISLLEESKIMQLISNQGGSDHLVKLYRAVHHDGGTGVRTFRAGGAALGFDPLPFDPAALNYNPNMADPTRLVRRMYIEYCDRGDLRKKMENDAVLKGEQGAPDDWVYKEEHIWRLFECLAKACCYLEKGSESVVPNVPDWGTPIVHLDFKSENIFIGDHNETHERLQVHKLGDFGLSLRAAPIGMAGYAAYRADARWRSTDGYMAPEQLYGIHQEIGPLTNIWHLGVTLYELMTRIPGISPAPGGTFQTVIQVGVVEMLDQIALHTRTTSYPHIWPAATCYQTFGPLLIDTPYSKALIELVHRCLADNPNDRPTAQQLAHEIDTRLTADYPIDANPFQDHLGDINPLEPLVSGAVGTRMNRVVPPTVAIAPPAGSYCLAIPPTSAPMQPAAAAPPNPFAPAPPPDNPPFSFWDNWILNLLIQTFTPSTWPWNVIPPPEPGQNYLPAPRMRSIRQTRRPQRYGFQIG